MALPAALVGGVGVVWLGLKRWTLARSLGGWFQAGVLLAWGTGAWAFLPFAWLLAASCWRRDAALYAPPRPLLILPYLAGFASGAGGWWIIVQIWPA